MSIETPADLAALRRVGHITRLALDALERNVRAGVTTAELDAVAAALFDEHGARSAPAMVYKFPGHVLISINDEVVHGVPGPRMHRTRRPGQARCDGREGRLHRRRGAERHRRPGDGYGDAAWWHACAPHFAPALSVARAGTRVNEIGRAVQDEVRAAWIRRRPRAVRPWRRPHDSRRTDGPQYLRSLAEGRAHGRPRDHHRADDYGWLVASRQKLPTAGRSERQTGACPRTTSTPL